MADFKQIVVLDNEIEANIMEDILKDREIPHIIQSYHVPGYDGVFQFHKGWGHIEAEEEYRDEILEIYNDIKKEAEKKVKEEFKEKGGQNGKD
ncbi:MAG TPA: hypothetical protein VJ907_07825 [Halanaerobiales bacterium]|nr:hypothetical protein [Halanaerobiales bacterium]